MFTKPVRTLIKNRISSRTYISKKIESEKIDLLKKFIEENNKNCPFNSPSRFEIVFLNEDNKDELKGLITYGFIKNPQAFIVGAVKNSPKNLEDYGYLLERIILFATDIGLSTCWLGGTFSKSSFAKNIKLKNDEILPAIAVFGYKTEKRGFVDSLIRWGADSKNRLSWEKIFFEDDFNKYLSIKNAGSYVLPLEMVRLAPSASNKQPWRIIKESQNNIFHFILERTKGYNKYHKLLNTSDLQRIDIGIAMCHFELCAKETNISGKWEVIQKGVDNLSMDREYIVSWIQI